LLAVHFSLFAAVQLSPQAYIRSNIQNKSDTTEEQQGVHPLSFSTVTEEPGSYGEQG
jgi:hypothetical protein